jgi:FtsP/CotA-like multicopper oxidase with cupredoxin domain
VYLPLDASKARVREAENARRNRLEIVKALSHGQISRRDLFKWGLFTTTGMIAAKNGLSVYAPSAYGQVPTGTPRSPLGTAVKFNIPLSRPLVQTPYPLVHDGNGNAKWKGPGGQDLPELMAKKFSWHNEFSANPGDTRYVNPVTGKGPIEGRPPGEFFAHQRWMASGSDSDLFPKVGYLMSIGQCEAGSRFHPGLAEQNANSVWSFGTRLPGHVGPRTGSRFGYCTPCLFKLRYGEPAVTRIYNDLPDDRTQNGGFGRGEISTHFHNAHHGAESDGASNAYHFPGTFYDYHWSLALARRDLRSVRATTDPRYLDKASGPTDSGGLQRVEGDFRELQSSLWVHDHRFFFTAENVHKGMFALANIYSGPDRGCETLNDGINLRLPSGWLNNKTWGNTDFDVNLAVSNPALAQDGQLFFDIFDTDGFVGDILCVNGSYYPYFNVLPRRYRFRILNASMSRFIKLALVVNRSAIARGTKVPFHFIANDGNLVVNPLKLSELDEQGVGERYDIVVDFRSFRPGDSIYLANLLKQTSGRRPDGAVTVGQALAGDAEDPCVGPILEFRVVTEVQSVDAPGQVVTSSAPDQSTNFAESGWTSGVKTLTRQIPVVAPVRVREFEYGRSGGGDSRGPDGQCIPDCPEGMPFPWSIKVDGQAAHTFNANRISTLIPKPGEVEHWTLKNGGGGWDHPIHLHFEEGVTIDRGSNPIPSTERLVRKDVWRLRPGGEVKVQVRFGEFGGAYVNHCHNTAHEDFAMILRMQVLAAHPDQGGTSPHHVVTKTPIPTPNGVLWKDPEILPEGDPRTRTVAGSSGSG